MKAKIFLIVLMLCMVCVPLAAKADTLPMTLTGVNYAYSDNGYALPPYVGTVGGVANLPLWCVDFTHPVQVGDSWTAYVNPVSGPISHTYHNDVTTYKEMTYLIQQIPTQTLFADKAAMQWVIWDLSSGQDHSSYYHAKYDFWLNEAQTKYQTGDYSGWFILTDKNGVKQEFIYNAPVPEPATMLLLGSGLVGLVGFGRKRLGGLTGKGLPPQPIAG